ncbi:MAG: hypothetical protein WEC39_02510 [Patescibacteria group bacterium]
MEENPWALGRKWGFLIFFTVIIFSGLVQFLLVLNGGESGHFDYSLPVAVLVWALEWGILFFVLPASLGWFFGEAHGFGLAEALKALLLAILVLVGFFVLPILTITFLFG